jgi:hypothetical protein
MLAKSVDLFGLETNFSAIDHSEKHENKFRKDTARYADPDENDDHVVKSLFNG